MHKNGSCSVEMKSLFSQNISQFERKLSSQPSEVIYTNLLSRRTVDEISVYKVENSLEEGRIKHFPNSPVNFTIWLLVTAGGATKRALQDYSHLQHSNSFLWRLTYYQVTSVRRRHKGTSLCSSCSNALSRKQRGW
jgi:hypothetical protein